MNQLNVQDLWRSACDILQQRMSASSFSTWILTNPLTEYRLIGDDRAIGVITSPTAFHSTNVEKNFYAQIKEVLDQISGRNSELQFQVGAPDVSLQEPLSVNSPPFTYGTPVPQPVISQPVQHIATQINPIAKVRPVRSTPKPLSIQSLQERLQQLATTQQQADTVSSPSASSPTIQTPASSLFSDQTIQSLSVDRARVQAHKAGLRPDYTIETFAVSGTNEMAHAAAMAVSNQPGTAYNPLFIYGGVGVGKTHLMHAVGNNILKRHPDSRVLYCTGEDFTNEIVHAIQTKKSMLFKEKFRTVDILLIDDVQFIAGKNTVQEEFFHTFNTITKRAGQIILTSDRSPAEISLLEDRLRSRFEAGLMVDIQQPSFELRSAILLIKSTAMGLSLPMDLAQVIATRIDSARKLEGIIKSIKSEVELKHRQITPELIDELCKSETERPHQKLRVKPTDVIKTVADFYQLKQSALRGKVRVKSIVRARHVAMFFLKEELHMPYMEVGRWFSNRDHTSALHALRKITAEVQTDQELRKEVQNIRVLLEKISK
jgi:chromosomal replication initiator protein